MCVQCDVENAALCGDWYEVIRLAYQAKREEMQAICDTREKEANEVRAEAGRMLQEKEDELVRLRATIAELEKQ